MSTDFNINLAQLYDKGLIETLEPYTDEHHYQDEFGETKVESYEGTRAKFVGYEYYRDCDVDDDELHLSCSGGFRQWLTQYLNEHQIEYMEY